jgi:formate hydrogenlyase subunit 6/NADH:ubiquinone oxidoreductase subunit I
MIYPGKILREVIGGGLFKKPATLLYPYEKEIMPLGFRGKLTFYAERCVNCKLCMKDCPSEAIQINVIGEKKYQAIVNLGRCLFCGQCVLSCNKDALAMTTNYELAGSDRPGLTVDIGRGPAAAPGESEGAGCADEEMPRVESDAGVAGAAGTGPSA